RWCCCAADLSGARKRLGRTPETHPLAPVRDMPALPPLPPIATQPLSVVLLPSNSPTPLEAAVAEWVTFLNGLDRAYELLVVPEGGDPVAAPAKGLSNQFQRVRVLRPPSRRGEGAALRAALAEARFPLIAYAPCDPRYRPGDLKRLMQDIDQVHLV